MRLTIFIVLLALSGCVSRPAIDELPISEVCERYQSNQELKNSHAVIKLLSSRSYDPRWAEELERRKFFTDEEMTLIQEQKIKIGIRSELLRCIFGYPNAINRTVSQSGTSEQWVFRSAGWYVYTENGLVTSWQN